MTLEQSEKRERINALLDVDPDKRTEAETAELDTLGKRLQALEPELRAALASEAAEGVGERTEDAGDAETRERRELKAKATVAGYLKAALAGRMATGAEAEYAAAVGVEGIPLALFEADETGGSRANLARNESRADAPTPAPSTVGVNMAPIVPAVFARSVAGSLGITMPMVGTGTYAQPRITANLSASFKAAGADTDSTAATISVDTMTPKRLSARMSVRVEDVASIGMSDFEGALRQNLSAVFGNVLDKAILAGDGASNGIEGLLHGLTDPTAAAALATFDSALATVAGLVDGTWAMSMRDVRLLCGPATYTHFETIFRDGTQAKGDVSLSAYLMDRAGGFRTSSQMPAVAAGGAAAKKQRAVAFRGGMAGVRTAVMASWGSFSIEDVYTGAGKGERYYTVSTLVSDVKIVHADAYSELEFQVVA